MCRAPSRKIQNSSTEKVLPIETEGGFIPKEKFSKNKHENNRRMDVGSSINFLYKSPHI
jgi:hypothetical protein